jgi:hypothetical protein
MQLKLRCNAIVSLQGRPLGGASEALAPGANFDRAPKRQSPTGHTLIRSTVARWFPHLQTKRVSDYFFNLVVLVVLAFTYVYKYSRYALCLLLQILLDAALEIKTRDVPTVSSINSLLSQYCIASHFCFANFYVRGGGGRPMFALPRLSHGQKTALLVYNLLQDTPYLELTTLWMRILMC